MEVATTAQSGAIVAKDTSKSNSPAIRNYRRFLPNLFSSTLQMWRYAFTPTKLLPPDVGGLILSRDEIGGLNLLTMINKKHSIWKTSLMASAPFIVLSISSALFALFSITERLSAIGAIVSFLFMISALVSAAIQSGFNEFINKNTWTVKLQKAINNLSIKGIEVPNIIRNALRTLAPGSETIDMIVFRKLGARDSLAMIRLAHMLFPHSDSIDILTVDGETSELLSRVHSAIENSSLPPPSVKLNLAVMGGL